jgi:hypothetical protein
MTEDDWFLVVAVACNILYCGAVGILLWFNPKSGNAWLLAVGAVAFWPFLFVAGPAQLLLVIPLATKFVIDGCDITKPVSTKTIYWALGVTSAFMIVSIVVSMLLDT